MNTWLWSLGQDTITVAVLLPFVALACRLVRNRPAVQHALWVVVLLKFLTPPIVSWPWTVEQIREALGTTPASVSAEERSATLLAPEGDGPSNVSNVSKIQHDPDLVEGSVESAPTPNSIDKPSESSGASLFQPRHTKTIVALQVLAGIWLLGAILCGFFQLRRIARHAELVRHGTLPPDQLAVEIKTVAKRLGSRPPQAVLARGITSPFVWCLGYLRLVWPEAMASTAAIARSRGVIAHELAHVRRFDHWVAWLELVAGIVWWWNPLFWFVRRRLRETAEMACDALAIAACPGSRREYAELLLELSAGLINGSPATVLAVSAGPLSSFERRLSMILSDRVSGKLSSWGILAAIGFALVILPGWSLGQRKEPQKAPPQGALALAGQDKAAADPDLARLEGAWELVSEEHNGAKRPLEFTSYQVTFKGKSVTTVWIRDEVDGAGVVTRSEGKSPAACTVTVNSTKNPKELTITGDNLKIQAIYKLEKDRLTIAHFGKPEGARPTGFKPAKGDDNILVVRVLEREKEEQPPAAPNAKPGSLPQAGPTESQGNRTAGSSSNLPGIPHTNPPKRPAGGVKTQGGGSSSNLPGVPDANPPATEHPPAALSQADRGEEKLWTELGVKVERVQASAVRKAKQELGGGLKVLSVRPGSPASKAEISKDDIIVGLHIWETLSIDSCLFILDQCREDEVALLKCSFVRNGRMRSAWVQLPPGKTLVVPKTANDLPQSGGADEQSPTPKPGKTDSAPKSVPARPADTSGPGSRLEPGLGFPFRDRQQVVPKVRDDPDYKRLQGRWVLVKTESEGKARAAGKDPFVKIVHGRKVTLLKGENVIWEGKLLLIDSTSKPARYDFKMTSKYRLTDSPSYGIYELKGDELKTRSVASDVKFYPNTAEVVRPKSFDTKDSRDTVFFWKRQK